MVLIWNDLACGDREAAALLVAINSVFQILAYALLGSFNLQILPGWLGLDSQAVQFSPWEISKAVLIFLGLPLLAGALTRWLGVGFKGIRWYETRVRPRLSPWASAAEQASTIPVLQRWRSRRLWLKPRLWRRH